MGRDVMAKRGRRGNNEGSIHKRKDGRWEAQVSLPDGRRKSLYAPTRAEAAAKMTALLRDLQRGLPVPLERLTVADYLTDWLAMKKLDLRPSTYLNYETRVRVHILPAIGHIPLTKLSAVDLNRMYAASVKAGLSATSVHGHHRILHKALQDAMRSDLVARNVAELDSPPRPPRYEAQTFTVDEARRFLAAIHTDRYQALYLLAIMTGMREGELLALTWPMIDFDTGTLHVRATHVRIHGQFVVTEPKTSAGRRVLFLNDMTRAALVAHRERQHEERAALTAHGGRWGDSLLVFPDEQGQRIAPTTFYGGRFLPLLQRAELPRIRFHDLRHTVATFLLLVGVDATIVANILGHANPRITQTIYQHVQPDMQRDALAALQRLLLPEPAPPIVAPIVESDPAPENKPDNE